MSLIIKEIPRFLIAGTAVNATDIGVYWLLLHILPFSAAKAISFTCAGTTGYFLNKFWTFKYAKEYSHAETSRYILINVLALIFNVLINQTMLFYRPGCVWAALAAATVVTGAFTFVCFKWWVFKL